MEIQSSHWDSEGGAGLRALLDRAQAGSNSALGRLLQVHRDYLLRLADLELGSDLCVKMSASDVVQESCLEAQRDFRQFSGTSPAEFRHWLRRLVLNNVSNVGRRFRGTDKRDIQREEGGRDIEQMPANSSRQGDSSVSAGVSLREQLALLRLAVSNLPPHYGQVIQWRNYDRLTFEEIGRLMGRSAEAARKVWARAIEKLQLELDHPNGSSIASTNGGVRRDPGEI